MLTAKNLPALCAALILTAGCTDTISGQLDFVNALERTEKTKLPNTTVTLDGKAYEIRRTLITSFSTKTGEKAGEREVWSIVNEGTVLRCIRANAESCQRALDGETREDMGGDY